jgi:hypothetical protein
MWLHHVYRHGFRFDFIRIKITRILASEIESYALLRSLSSRNCGRHPDQKALRRFIEPAITFLTSISYVLKSRFWILAIKTYRMVKPDKQDAFHKKPKEI